MCFEVQVLVSQLSQGCLKTLFNSFLSIVIEGGNLAASNIRNLECSSYEVYLIDYGCGKFNKKVHIME